MRCKDCEKIIAECYGLNSNLLCFHEKFFNSQNCREDVGLVWEDVWLVRMDVRLVEKAVEWDVGLVGSDVGLVWEDVWLVG